MEEMIEKVAQAIEAADNGYQIKLVKLVDDESTYLVDYFDGSVPEEIVGYEEAVDKANARRRIAKARAAIEAMREPTEAMKEAGDGALSGGTTTRQIDGVAVSSVALDAETDVWRAMIDEALR